MAEAVKAIRAFCLGCCGDSSEEVKSCPNCFCPLHPFRNGGTSDGK